MNWLVWKLARPEPSSVPVPTGFIPSIKVTMPVGPEGVEPDALTVAE